MWMVKFYLIFLLLNVSTKIHLEFEVRASSPQATLAIETFMSKFAVEDKLTAQPQAFEHWVLRAFLSSFLSDVCWKRAHKTKTGNVIRRSALGGVCRRSDQSYAQSKTPKAALCQRPSQPPDTPLSGGRRPG